MVNDILTNDLWFFPQKCKFVHIGFWIFEFWNLLGIFGILEHIDIMLLKVGGELSSWVRIKLKSDLSLTTVLHGVSGDH